MTTTDKTDCLTPLAHRRARGVTSTTYCRAGNLAVESKLVDVNLIVIGLSLVNDVNDIIRSA